MAGGSYMPPAKLVAMPRRMLRSGLRRQQLKIDRVRHCLISIILRMEMIAGIECCEDVRRTVRIPCHRVEVDHAIELATSADPLVDGLAFLLLLRVVVPLERFALEGVLERRQCGADDAHSVEMGARDELLVAVDDGVRRRRWLVWRQETARPTDVVNAHHQNYSVRVRVAQHVTVEACQRINTHAVAKHAGSGDSLV